MQLIKTPTKGMNDYLPRETRLREYVKGVIIRAYEKNGFSMIETPAVEHIENLTGKNGGDNEKLIFKIMKRGEKLNEAAGNDAELCDSGLRYDLTVPLSRYYANNQAKLPSPFMAMQIGNVWRADRPQKGRFRQFTQCDIDILGDSTQLAEITLISATTGVLRELGFDNFTVRINDRRLLKVCADYCGFKPEDCDKVFITLDKMDKIGLDGVKRELVEEGFDEASVEKYVALYENCDAVSVSEFAADRLGGNGADIAASLESIMRCATAATAGGCSLKFDPTLVRGMSYYTGTIFEISMDGYGYSVGGGGRYDEMLAKFSGQKTPACGFSLGFERIVAALADRGFEPPAERSVAFLASKNMDEQKMLAMLSDAARLRADGARVLVTPRMKNVGFQKTKLADDGYTEFVEY